MDNPLYYIFFTFSSQAKDAYPGSMTHSTVLVKPMFTNFQEVAELYNWIDMLQHLCTEV
jgi:hypothetical protein